MMLFLDVLPLSQSVCQTQKRVKSLKNAQKVSKNEKYIKKWR